MIRKLSTSALDTSSVPALLEHIRKLSHDDSFGMLTRPALLHQAGQLHGPSYIVAFIDLDHLRVHNQAHGYDEVNNRVRKTFRPALRYCDLVGRWFSGDELVLILSPNDEMAQGLIDRLHLHATANNLSFTHAVATWRPASQRLVTVINKLSVIVTLKKASRDTAA